MLVRLRQGASSSPLPTGVIFAPPAPELSPPELDPALLTPPGFAPPVFEPPAPAAPAGAFPPVALIASPPAPLDGVGPPERLLAEPHERTRDSVTAAELRPILTTMTTSL